MDRRAFLKSFAGAGTIAAAGGLVTPAISQRAAARTVRLVPHADLANFDPVWTSAYIARNAGLLVWDTLYGMDAGLKVQRQMVEAEEVSSDGLTWTFRLRSEMKFHDGEPVTAWDAVAQQSIAGQHAIRSDSRSRRSSKSLSPLTIARSAGCSGSPMRRCCSHSARSRRPAAS